MPFKGIYPLHFEKVKKNMLEQKKAPRSIEYLVVVSSMGCDSEMLYCLLCRLSSQLIEELEFRYKDQKN